MSIVTKALRLDEKLKDDLDVWAGAEGCSSNELIVSVLTNALASSRDRYTQELSECRAQLSVLEAIQAKIGNRAYWELIRADEFEENESAHDWVATEAAIHREILGQAIAAGQFDSNEVDLDEPAGPTVTDLQEETAQYRDQEAALLTKLAALNEASTLKEDHLIEERQGGTFISPQGLIRIKKACQAAQKDWRQIGEIFLYRHENAWIARAQGVEPLSKRALNKLRDWLESIEGK